MLLQNQLAGVNLLPQVAQSIQSPPHDAPRTAYKESQKCGLLGSGPAHTFFERIAGTLPVFRRVLLEYTFTSWMRKLDRLDGVANSYCTILTRILVVNPRLVLPSESLSVPWTNVRRMLTHHLLWSFLGQ